MVSPRGLTFSVPPSPAPVTPRLRRASARSSSRACSTSATSASASCTSSRWVLAVTFARGAAASWAVRHFELGRPRALAHPTIGGIEQDDGDLVELAPRLVPGQARDLVDGEGAVRRLEDIAC